ncbi:uncharacterized protein LOC113360474 [Papaver somniferum]|uniref:uncharacterized protein LOC113360474 n=1 Tax=Papaver somniferum TaxID=3469 RepID=UPI000E7016C1|nr:uncharacterized protein LOC113360474 [Papaver somniferum]
MLGDSSARLVLCGLNNFFFNIFTKIVASRLGGVLDKLISEEYVAFMKGRNIHENITVASEMVNELKVKRKDGMKTVQNLLNLLGMYQRASGHTVCRQKIKIYFGGGVLRRRQDIADLTGMGIASLPDRYLGVKIMPGAVKYHHISNVVDKIKNQLAVWKGILLSFQDRVVLVNSVIARYSIHNMDVYKWPRKFIYQCEREIHNFLWSGDAEISRAFVVSYDKVCSPVKEGGLGISRLATTNKAMLTKL